MNVNIHPRFQARRDVFKASLPTTLGPYHDLAMKAFDEGASAMAAIVNEAITEIDRDAAKAAKHERRLKD